MSVQEFMDALDVGSIAAAAAAIAAAGLTLHANRRQRRAQALRDCAEADLAGVRALREIVAALEDRVKGIEHENASLRRLVERLRCQIKRWVAWAQTLPADIAATAPIDMDDEV